MGRGLVETESGGAVEGSSILIRYIIQCLSFLIDPHFARNLNSGP